MRKPGLDLCRVIACMGVVLIHTLMLFWDFDPASPTWIFYNLAALAMRLSVPLFFMISGALLLGRERLDFNRHLRRLLHFVLLFYLWSLICHGIDRLLLHVWNEGDFLIALLSGYYHLWYLPALALCYSALPLLHGLIHGEAENTKKGALLLAGVVAVRLTLALIPGKSAWLSALLASWKLSDFTYLVYFLLGWLLSRVRLPKRALWLLGLAALAAVLVLAHLNRRYSIGTGRASDLYYGYLTPSAALSAALVFCLCLRAERIPPRLGGVLKTLSDCTFGVYLTHPVFIDALRSLHLDFTQYNTLLFLPLCYVSLLLLPLAATWLLRRIPLLKKLVS